MSLFVPFRRATLLIPTGAAHDPDRKHLFIVLTDPAQVLDFDAKYSLLAGEQGPRKFESDPEVRKA